MPMVRTIPAIPGEDENDVEDQRDVREHAPDAIGDHHEGEHQHGGDDTCGQAGLDRVSAKAGVNSAFFDDVEAGRQSAGAQQHGKVIGAGRGEAAADLARTTGDRLVDDRRGDHLVVEHDGKALADIARGDFAKGDGAARVELEADDRDTLLLVIGRLGINERLAAERHVFIDKFKAARLAGQDHGAGRQALGLGLCRAHARIDHVEGQAGRLRNDVFQPRGIAKAGNLHENARVALALDRRLGGAQLVDTAADHFHRLGDQRAHALGNAFGCQRDGQATVSRLAKGEFVDPHPAEQHIAERVLQAADSRFGLRLLAGIGQLDIERVARLIGGDDIADAILVGEDVTRIAPHIAQPLADDTLPVHFEQQVRAALQIETQDHALLWKPPRQRIKRRLGKEVGNGEENPRDRNEQNQGCAERRMLHFRSWKRRKPGPLGPG
jgi:hypothetical protein